MTPGKRLTAERKAAGMSQQVLAERLGVSRSLIAQWEGDRCTMEEWYRQLGALFNVNGQRFLVDTSTARVARESKFETELRKYAIARGWLVYKIQFIGVRSAPDRLFIRNGVYLWIEAKRVGEEPNTQQRMRHAEMRAAGANVVWATRIEDVAAVLA